ncbi:hypothetical protein [Sporosarcina limicola]|uniref:Uncharacterized protein n=1 Tax=Sporosarcina limicola TaxID=34101 RepID=A0A927R4N3_9BACL|nr:hypothetical protein [Sporosarcina limicola]MBE1556396.1 hypothetical protein [Sporosarcina limicola]
MKVTELRKIVKEQSREELETLLVEIYKLIPKKVREEKDIDALIENPQHYKISQMRGGKKEKVLIDFEVVKCETIDFIKYAYAHYYIAPNQTIPKKERAKWRFTAKKLYDQLSTSANQPEHTREAVNLLEQLYKLLCYASGHYVFASEEPFYTIKVSQPDFLSHIISLKKHIDEPEKWIRESLLLILINDRDQDVLHSELRVILLDHLNAASLKNEAIHICEELLSEKISAQAIIKSNKSAFNSSSNYEKERYRNNLVGMLFICQSSLNEYEKAVQTFK